MTTVILDGYSANPGDISWSPITRLGDVTIYDRTAPDQVIPRAIDADCVMVNKVKLDAPTLKSLPNLKYIGVLATGTNVVDLAAAHELGIVVTNIPSYSTDSVAQMTWALILALTNSVEHYTDLNRKGEWSRSADFCYWDRPIMELSGKQIGIIGFGNIGRRVAEIAHAMGMKVVTSSSKGSSLLPAWVEKVSADTLFATSDIISLHTPLTPATHHMINEKRLRQMKRTALLINTSRGPLIDESALVRVLTEGLIAGAGIDVMETEPPAPHNPLLSAPRCMITPHIAWASKEARIRLVDIAAANLSAFMSGSPVNVV